MRGKTLLAALLVAAAIAAAPVAAPASHAAPDKTTKYRVYQNDTALSEFSDQKEAIDYARRYANSHVEQIGDRQWVWDNFPRYRLYQYDVSLPGWEFATLDEAVAVARYYGHAAVRDMQSTGWVWNNWPRYRVYQGGITLDSWEFIELKDAIAEAKKWAGSHIIDLNTNRWVWDNIPAAEKERLRKGTPVYQVYQGDYTSEQWKFAYLEDAVNEALKWANSVVVDTSNGNKVVYSNLKMFKVYQNDTFLDEFVSLGDAADYARLWAHAKIVYNGKEIWNNYPYYRVYQNENPIGEFHTIPDALRYATGYSNASIRTYHGERIWNNYRKLLYWAWNGSSNGDTIKKQVQNTVGLDVDSPTWFQLADAQGGLNDTSNKETVEWLKSQGYAVHPLVSNQFDTALTTQFLANPAAQRTFIQALTSKAAELGVNGINIDFENVSGKDRAAFTGFMQALTDAAHEKGLLVSIDLPRGSVKWNHLTAFDHEKLAGIVDYIVTMTYDQHYSGSDTPGSVAGLQWTEEGVKEFLSYGIPRDKLLLGIPYYVREWKLKPDGGLESNRAIYIKDVPALIESKKAKAVWDDKFMQYRVEYEEGGFRYVFWLENEDTVKARLDIAKKYDLAGVAVWRLGYEPADLWKTMLQHK